MNFAGMVGVSTHSLSLPRPMGVNRAGTMPLVLRPRRTISKKNAKLFVKYNQWAAGPSVTSGALVSIWLTLSQPLAAALCQGGLQGLTRSAGGQPAIRSRK
jgi:hypothetical protein